MWSAFTELHPTERPRALKKVAETLKPSGILVIDMPKEILGHGQVEQFSDGYNEVIEPYGILRTHHPTRTELEELAMATHFKVVEQIDYCTSTGIPRTTFVLSKLV